MKALRQLTIHNWELDSEPADHKAFKKIRPKVNISYVPPAMRPPAIGYILNPPSRSPAAQYNWLLGGQVSVVLRLDESGSQICHSESPREADQAKCHPHRLEVHGGASGGGVNDHLRKLVQKLFIGDVKETQLHKRDLHYLKMALRVRTCE